MINKDACIQMADNVFCVLQTTDNVLGHSINNKQLDVPFISVSLSESPMLPDNAMMGQTVQAVTLSDGTTAYIQPPKGKVGGVVQVFKK